MESKYYTPKIEEFCVGFEYAELVTEPVYNERWKFKIKKQVLKNTDIKNTYKLSFIEQDIELDRIRVKYLDREDIESLGWRKGWEFDNDEMYILEKDGEEDIQLYYNSLTENLELGIGISLYIGNVSSVNIYIKNKSELKKLMQQLGIDNG